MVLPVQVGMPSPRSLKSQFWPRLLQVYSVQGCVGWDSQSEQSPDGGACHMLQIAWPPPLGGTRRLGSIGSARSSMERGSPG